MFEAFQKGNRIKELGVAKKGIVTGDNNRFMRFFWEVNEKKINYQWYLCSKGGNFRKYYGNLIYVVNWSQNAQDYYINNKSSSTLKKEYCMKEGVTYNTITSGTSGFRYLPMNYLFVDGGPTVVNISNIFYCLGVLNSKITKLILDILNPTINLKLYNVNEIPIIFDESFDKEIGIYLLVIL